LAATAPTGTQVNLTWTASTDNVGVTGYLVERCQGAGCSTFAQVLTPTGTSVSDTGLTSGTSYSYRVRATDAAGNLSGYSNVATVTPTADTTPPTAPSNLAATAVSTSQINLTWTAATDDVAVTGYRVERCVGANCSSFAQVLTPTGTSVSDTGLAAGTSYSYRVRATDAAGNLGPYSNTSSATTFVASGTISFVQVKGSAPHSSQSSVSLAYTNAQTAGNTNVVVVGWGDTAQTIQSVTDTKGNVYAPAAGPTINASGGLTQTIYYATNIAAAPAGGNTVTVTFSGAAAFPDVRVLEYSGVDTVTPIDVVSTSTGSGGTSSTTAVATTNAVDLLFGANVVATSTTGAGSGFTNRLISTDGNIVEDRLVTATGSYSATATLNSGQWLMQMVAFRAAGSPPPPPDTIPPTVPGSLTATVLGTQINLTWAASTDNVAVTGYRLERCQGSGCSNFAQIATPTGTSFADTGLSTSTSYSYRVRAIDGAGNLSGYSNVSTATTASAPSNPIVLENQQAGSNAWQVGFVYGRTYADDTTQQIKGYASATSINKGESISFHVSVNPAQSYTVDVYRLGWYGGLGGRLMQHIGPLNGVQEQRCPINAQTGLIECNWSVGYTLQTQTSWTSGIYLAVLKNSQNFYNYIVFCLRDDNRVAALLYQQSVTTYQAYNNYPDDGATGKSLYEINSVGPNTMAGTTRAVKVSFDRPYADDGAGTLLWLSEMNTIRWLEKSGYDLTYSTNLDTHENGQRIMNYRGFISVPHDEYWSRPMYDTVFAARDAGVNMAFLGANSIFWQIRFEPSSSGVADRIVVCYKDANLDPVTDSTIKTVEWRQDPVDRAEQQFLGVEFTDGPNSGTASYVVTNSSNWVYAGTGLTDGTVIPGIVWYETDRQVAGDPLPNAVPGTYVLLSHSPYPGSQGPEYSNSSIYQAPSGAWVFASGTHGWGWGLDNYYPEGSVNTVDARIQKATSNVLDRFGGR
jgi:chitodextrinase